MTSAQPPQPPQHSRHSCPAHLSVLAFQLQCSWNAECRARGLRDDLVRRDRSPPQRILCPEGAHTKPRPRRAPASANYASTPTRRRVYTCSSRSRSAQTSCALHRPPSSQSGEVGRLFGARYVLSAHSCLRARPTLLPLYSASLPPVPTSRPSPQDGSMFEAVDGMNDERAFIFTCFGASTCHMHMPTCTAVSQSSPHSYQRSTWSTYTRPVLYECVAESQSQGGLGACTAHAHMRMHAGIA